MEYEIDQQLKISSSKDVEKMGIANYNAACRGIVDRYCGEWRKVISRLGRWIDFDNDYKTMDKSFMESVWWVFKQVYDKDLVYRSFRVMPYSTAVATPLSNFEAGQNYKDVSDPAIVVTFPLVEDADGAAFLAWTTTPWTLPSNVALCVNPEMEYVKIRDNETSKVYILAVERLVQIYPKIKADNLPYAELARMKGVDLKGKKYQPIFPFFVEKYGPTGFRIIADAFVTNDSGTGIVHCAPAFGEDDYRVCVENGVVTKSELPCPVDEDGRFTNEVPNWEGRHVKEADADICKVIKDMGRLLKKDTYRHSYPFCWRSDTPLIYKAVPSWFVRVEAMRDSLLKNNGQTNWVPAFVKEKRFHNWLANARDWNISRNRYWGTPLPVWANEDFSEIVVIGSVAELEELSGQKLNDLHREYVDQITIPSKKNPGTVLRRIKEVFDCWFESGSMPYAQIHYPFENQELFKKGFPANFIAEGLDQTRGWFYTLMVLSTALFDKPPFLNVIVNGLVLAADGKKMSKRLKNYPDPLGIVEQYGADSLRLYLINSPVVRAAELNFNASGVHNVVKDVLLPWYNAFRFFVQNARRWCDSNIDEKTGKPVDFDTTKAEQIALESTNIMDRWIIAALHELIRDARNEMDGYRLYTVVPELLRFIEQLTNWYVRLNRPRFKSSDNDSLAAISTLYVVLLNVCKLMSPLTPFFAEYMYQFLTPESEKNTADKSKQSIHYLMMPEFNPARLDARMQLKMQLLQSVIIAGRASRDRRGVAVKQPLYECVVFIQDEAILGELKELEVYIAQELNVHRVTLTCDATKWAELKAMINLPRVGKRLGSKVAAAKKEVESLTSDQIRLLQKDGKIVVAGDVELSVDDIIVNLKYNGDTVKYEATVATPLVENRLKSVELLDENDSKQPAQAQENSASSALRTAIAILDMTIDEPLEHEFIAREVISSIQKMRKNVGIQPTDTVNFFYKVSPLKGTGLLGLQPVKVNAEECARKVNGAITSFSDSMIKKALRYPLYSSEKMPKHAIIIGKESFEINDGALVEVIITWPFVVFPAGKHVDSSPAENLLASFDFEYLKSEVAKSGDNTFAFTLANGERKVLKRGIDFTFSPEEPFTN